jgi:hypothetical protein
MKWLLNIMLGLAAASATVFGLGYYKYTTNTAALDEACRAGATPGICDCLDAKMTTDLGAVRGAALSSSLLRPLSGVEARDLSDYATNAVQECTAALQ